MTDQSNGPRRQDDRPRRALLAAITALAAVLLGLLLLLRPFEPRPEPPTSRPTSGPAAATPNLLTAGTSPGPSGAPPSVAPPGGPGTIGDYGCLTLADATAAIESDGFRLGEVAYTLEGGPVADDWLVARQAPAPGDVAAPGSAVDLIVSSPIFACPSP